MKSVRLTPLVKQSDPIRLLWPTEPWEKNHGAITEGPWMLKHDGTYYLLDAGSAARSLDYGIGYATAREATGPFTKYRGNPIVQRGTGRSGRATVAWSGMLRTTCGRSIICRRTTRSRGTDSFA